MTPCLRVIDRLGVTDRRPADGRVGERARGSMAKSATKTNGSGTVTRADLAEADRKTLLDAFMRVSCDIPSVQAARLGQRVTFGYGYESVPQPDYQFMVELDFVDADGLKAYLTHPAHRELADGFYAAVDMAHAYDIARGGVTDN
mgnify:CR=1 FL=1